MILDVSHNGSIADEASFLMALVGLAGLFIGGTRLGKKVKRIDHAVNNVDVPITDLKVATLGQRVVRLEGVSDETAKTMRSVGEGLNEHIRQSNFRHERIESKLDYLKEGLHVSKIID